METVEIRFRNKFLVPMLVFFVLMIVGVAGYVFVSAEYADKPVFKALQAVFTVGVLYYIYHHYTKLTKRGPLLVLTGSTLVMHDRKKNVQKTFLWNEIQEVKFEAINGEGLFLKVKGASDNAQTDLAWVDKAPKQIEGLIDEYRKAAALKV